MADKNKSGAESGAYKVGNTGEFALATSYTIYASLATLATLATLVIHHPDYCEESLSRLTIISALIF